VWATDARSPRGLASRRDRFAWALVLTIGRSNAGGGSRGIEKAANSAGLRLFFFPKGLMHNFEAGSIGNGTPKQGEDYHLGRRYRHWDEPESEPNDWIGMEQGVGRPKLISRL